MLLCQRAVKAGDLALVQAHVRRHGVGLQGKNGFQALHFAACYGRTEIAEYLLGILAPVNAQTTRGNTPLHIACFEGGVPMIELLVDHGADTSVLNWQVRSSKVLQDARFDQKPADCCVLPLAIYLRTRRRWIWRCERVRCRSLCARFSLEILDLESEIRQIGK